jgi:hypothetical protein
MFTLLLIITAILILPYILGPIVVYLTLEMPDRYELKELPSDAFLNERSHGFLSLHNQLLELGFRFIGGSSLANSHSKAFFSGYRNADGSTIASVTSASAPNISEQLTVAFGRTYSDGVCLSVNNSVNPEIFPPWHRKILFRFPDEIDPARLVVKFDAIHHGLGRTDLIEVPEGQELSAISKFLNDEILHLVSTKFARKPIGDGKLRLTLRGAFIGAWRLMWPWKMILKRKDSRLAELAAKSY